MVEAIFLSFVIINIFLIIADVKWRKKYQWPLGRFIRYAFFGGVIGFFIAIVFVVTWTLIYKGSQGSAAIVFFGPFFFAIGELAGFALFAWLEARKRKRAQGEA